MVGESGGGRWRCLLLVVVGLGEIVAAGLWVGKKGVLISERMLKGGVCLWLRCSGVASILGILIYLFFKLSNRFSFGKTLSPQEKNYYSCDN